MAIPFLVKICSQDLSVVVDILNSRHNEEVCLFSILLTLKGLSYFLHIIM